jgi:hypothetical protein
MPHGTRAKPGHAGRSETTNPYRRFAQMKANDPKQTRSVLWRNSENAQGRLNDPTLETVRAELFAGMGVSAGKRL